MSYNAAYGLIRYPTLLLSYKRAALRLFWFWQNRLRQPQVGDGHVVQGRHNDAAGDALGNRLVAVARVRLVGDLIEVEVHGSLADAEDGGDLPGGLALAGPEQALLLPIRQLGQVFHEVWPGLDEGQGRVEDVAGTE